MFSRLLKEKKKNANIGEPWRLEPVSPSSKKNEYKLYGHFECSVDTDWIKHLSSTLMEGVVQQGQPRKIHWNSVNEEVKRFIVCPERIHRLRTYGRRKLTQLTNRVLRRR